MTTSPMSLAMSAWPKGTMYTGYLISWETSLGLVSEKVSLDCEFKGVWHLKVHVRDGEDGGRGILGYRLKRFSCDPKFIGREQK
jgi:hypothetical protein